MTLALFEPISADIQKSMDAIAIELRERLPWIWQEGFALSRIEGYEPGVFGCRAGFLEDLSAYNALHEISHAIELVDSSPTRWKHRLNESNHGIRIKSFQTVLGDRYYEPVTMQPTERECRTGALQLHLLRDAGYSTDTFIEKFVKSLQYMSDSCFGGDSIMNTSDPKKYTPAQKEWVNIRTALIHESYANNSIENIQDTWSRVCQHLARKDFDLPSGIPIFR